MPIDPSIPLKAFDSAVAVKTPGQIQEDVAKEQLQKATTDVNRLKIDEMREEAQARHQMKQMLKETNGDIDKVIMRMMSINPTVALELKETVSKEAKAFHESQLSKQKAAQGVFETSSRILQGVVDQPTYTAALGELGRIVPEIASQLPPEYNPDSVKAVMERGVEFGTLNKARLDALEAFGKGDYDIALAGHLSTTRNQEERDQAFEGWKKMRGPGMIADRFDKEWNEQSLARDKQLLEQGLAQKRRSTSADTATSQSEDFLLDGKSVKGDYIPGRGGQPGRYFFNGEDVTGRARRIPTAQATTTATTADETDQLADMLSKGLITPAQLTKRGNYNAILAKANALSLKETGKPLNMTRIAINYEAAKRFATSLNTPQRVNFRSLAETVVNTIDEVKHLGEELKLGGVEKWNQAKRETLTKVYGNTEYSGLAARYMIAVNSLKEEFAQLANGGYAPTESAWKLANEQVNGNFGVKDMQSSLTELQRIINLRMEAMNDVQPALVPGGPPVAGYDPNAGNAPRPQGKISVAELPAEIAQLLKSPAVAERFKQKKSVSASEKDKSGKVIRRWTLHPDGTATPSEVAH